jgi:cellulose synthase/poly-beta-1,6-N-acetylglucosamine synthase-like glycosyltransferase
MQSAQRSYVSLDSLIKELESRRGSITSNDGKLYAIRRALFQPIAEGVTDDLFCALQVIDRGQRFVYEARATASIRTPARSAVHEVARRRRIVARSLRGMWLMRRVFHPGRSGFFAVGLFINKVLRRLLPVFFVLFVASALWLARSSAVFRVIAALALGFLLLASLSTWSGARHLPQPLRRLVSLAGYFVLGNWGTLLGILDFSRNRIVVRWDPFKADGAPQR